MLRDDGRNGDWVDSGSIRGKGRKRVSLFPPIGALIRGWPQKRKGGGISYLIGVYFGEKLAADANIKVGDHVVFQWAINGDDVDIRLQKTDDFS